MKEEIHTCVFLYNHQVNGTVFLYQKRKILLRSRAKMPLSPISNFSRVRSVKKSAVIVFDDFGLEQVMKQPNRGNIE